MEGNIPRVQSFKMKLSGDTIFYRRSSLQFSIDFCMALQQCCSNCTQSRSHDFISTEAKDNVGARFATDEELQWWEGNTWRSRERKPIIESSGGSLSEAESF